MKFSAYNYQRFDIVKVKSDLNDMIQAFNLAKDSDEQIKIVDSFLAYYDQVDSMMQLGMIRHSIDTIDPFYDQEQEFMNGAMPEIQEFLVNFTNSMLESKFRSALEKKYGVLLFKQAELSKKTFSPEIISLLQEENRLQTEYVKLRSSAKIEFNNQIYNLSQMHPFATDKDRLVRQKATLQVSNWFKSNESEFDKIYDQLVKTRHSMALKLGYENFIQLGYDRLKRIDYDLNDVKKYRDQVYKEIVPYVAKLQLRKANRLGIKDMKSYDLGLTFKDGNPTPKGDSTWQVGVAKKMYDEMSKETSTFFRYMVDKELLDLESKPNKEGGGYCTYIPSFESPFIFANFDGTSGDVDVLTHEAGHAFQVYTSRNLLPSYRWPSYEAAEIHSMSMEFLAWPWMKDFFLKDTEKYKFGHLSGAVEFLPYGVLVDEFQHEVYSHPEYLPEERKALWKSLEQKYLPWKKYDENDFMNEGAWWFKQGHIFQDPFYYIDYTLAQVVAFEFWGLSQIDHKKTWDKYYELCKLGGSKSFVELLNAAKLSNPFIDGMIKKTMEPIKAYLDHKDDSKF